MSDASQSPKNDGLKSSVLKPIHIPLFKPGDVGGVVYAFAGNIGNFIFVASVLLSFGWSKELVFDKVIPGISLGLMLQSLYYAWMGWKLARKKGNADVTAMPCGVSTPAMFIFLFGIIMPLQQGLNLPPEDVWHASLAACFLGGAIEVVASFFGARIRQLLPRVAMLATVAGIALVWMATKGLFDVYASAILGMPILIVALLGLIGGYMLRNRLLSPMLLAIVFGIMYALLLGKASINTADLGRATFPEFTLSGVMAGMVLIVPYLAVLIPIKIYNFIETMDNVEAAAAAGDEYSVGEAQCLDGWATMVAALFGGNIPCTAWLGHPGLKKSGAGIGFSWVSGLMFGVCGFFGAFSFFYAIMPEVLISVTYLWCAIIMIAQAFVDSPRRYGAAIGIALVPHMADYLYTQIHSALALANIYEFTPEVNKALVDAGVMWNGVEALARGAIISGMVWACLTVFIVDRRLNRAAWTCLVAGALSAFGFIHAPSIGLVSWNNPMVIGYLSMGVIFVLTHRFRHKLDISTRFDYV